MSTAAQYLALRNMTHGPEGTRSRNPANAVSVRATTAGRGRNFRKHEDVSGRFEVSQASVEATGRYEIMFFWKLCTWFIGLARGKCVYPEKKNKKKI